MSILEVSTSTPLISTTLWVGGWQVMERKDVDCSVTEVEVVAH